MRVVLIIGGALLGLYLAENSSTLLFGVLTGCALGWMLAEVIALQRRLTQLEKEIDAQQRRLAADDKAWREERPAEAPQPAAPPPTAVHFDPQPPISQAPTVVGGVTIGATPAAQASSATRQEPVSRAEGAHEHGAIGGALPPHEPPPPPQENEIVRAIREYFTGGNTLVRVGIVILFFGVAFLLRYVAERTQVPIELRLTGVAIGAIVLLVLGWRLRLKRPGYALALQGGATGFLYLIIFVALRLYSLLPASAALAAMVLVVVFSGMLAVLQSSIELAVLGIVGGFLAPILASAGQGDHIVLFGYYALLNAGILGIAWFKAWRPLNVLGFLFTFVIGIAWGVLRYRSELLSTTEPFLIYFFVLYVAIAILFASRQPPNLKGYVDGTIVFGTPIATFSLQVALLRHRDFALAFSALFVSAGYLILAWLLYRRRQDTYRLLVEAFMALGVAFLTLAIPLSLDGNWSAATWALEGAALVWIGCRQNRRLPRVSGALLQIGAGVIFWRDSHVATNVLPLLNSAFVGGILISVAAVFTAHLLNRAREQLKAYERWTSGALFFWGLAWWLLTGVMEIDRLADRHEWATDLIFVSATAWISSELHRRLDLGVARLPALALLPVMILCAIATGTRSHPFADGGWISWPLAFAAFYGLTRRYDAAPNTWSARSVHAVSAWFIFVLLGWESAWAIDQAVHGGGSWPALGWVLLPAIALLALPKLGDRITWPIAKHLETYICIVGGGIAIYLVAWMLYTNLQMPGDPYPLPYIPFLNPLDLVEIFALLVLAQFGLHLYRARYATFDKNQHRIIAGALAVSGFVWLNGVLVRTLHHWAGIAFDRAAMMSSTLAQTAVSIFWTVIALAAMLIATRRTSRIVWLTGAALLTAVVVKLFLVDLSRVGSVERIVSFVGVGVLMLVIGYFSPLPPARQGGEAK